MSIGLITLIVSFVVLLILGFPIAFSLLGATILYILCTGAPLTIVSQRLFEGMNGFPLLAVPFFLMCGQFMLKGKLLDPLIEAAEAFVGHIRGALAMVNVIVSLPLGSIIGLALADVTSLGSILIPAMKKEGYDADFSAAVTAASSLLGPMFPPSVLMILYAMAVGRTSIAGLFLAAVIPAILVCAVQCIVTYILCVKRNYPRHPKVGWKEKISRLKRALPALGLPVVILGTIFGRVCSVTEASALGALYAFILTVVVYRNVNFSEVINIVFQAGLTTGLVLLLAGAATVTGWVIANEQVVHSAVAIIGNWSPWLFLLALNIILLLNGCFMDDYASVLLYSPIIAPIAWHLGIHPLHIGFVICMNLVIGLSTPPFGIVLFVASPIAGVKFEKTARAALPLILATIGVLLLVTYVPQICLFLPRLFGFY